MLTSSIFLLTTKHCTLKTYSVDISTLSPVPAEQKISGQSIKAHFIVSLKLSPAKGESRLAVVLMFRLIRMSFKFRKQIYLPF
jgi:hypothetical protein